jgi:hypothetical protein
MNIDALAKKQEKRALAFVKKSTVKKPDYTNEVQKCILRSSRKWSDKQDKKWAERNTK